jgi:hypothetical protein
MAGPPQVPDRRSSLDSHIPQQKKRLSLSTMPILSKLGLGKTTSPPVSPTRHIPDALSPTMFAPPPVPEATNPVLDADLVQEPLSEEPDDFDANSNDAFTKRSDILATEPTTHGGRNGSLHLSIPDGALLSLSTPPRSKPSPNESTGSTTELGVLREVDENEDVKGRLEFIKSTQTITKPTSCPKSVWLCSKPPLSPPTSPTDTSMARRKFGGRPLVVRAMSTGRLASEFDDQGRVMCLSNHCERVLKSSSIIVACCHAHSR